MRKILLLVTLLALPCWAQDAAETIDLGVKLSLGMPQKEVLAAVGKAYDVKPLSDPSQYVVFNHPKEGEKPRWEGMLTFKQGKLESAEKLWAYQNDENSVALAKSLVAVLSSLLKAGHGTCEVQSLMSDAPDAQGESVFLNCGKRSLKISVAKVGDYKEDASVSEVLEKQ